MYNPKPDHKVLAPSKLKAYLQTTISKLLQWCKLFDRTAFSPFILFSTASCFQVVKTWDCVAQGYIIWVNWFPNDKLKAFADNKFNVATMMISLFDLVENTVGKGENAGCQHFLLFLQCFPKPSSVESLKFGILGDKEIILLTNDQINKIWVQITSL